MSLACNNLMISDTGPRKTCGVRAYMYVQCMNVNVHTYLCTILRWFDLYISLNHMVYPMALFMERIFSAVVISSNYFCGWLHYVLYWVYHNFQHIATLPCNRTLPFGQLGCMHKQHWFHHYTYVNFFRWNGHSPCTFNSKSNFVWLQQAML